MKHFVVTMRFAAKDGTWHRIVLNVRASTEKYAMAAAEKSMPPASLAMALSASEVKQCPAAPSV